MTYDIIEHIGGSVIQHGRLNDRIYLMSYEAEDIPALCSRFDELVDSAGYSKIFIKISDRYEKLFLERGFRREAVIPGFYGDGSDCLFMGAYPGLSDRARISTDEQEKTDRIRLKALESQESPPKKLPSRFTLRLLTGSDIESLCTLYRSVFPSYPFPVGEPEYIRQTMEESVVYFCIFDGDRLAAASSAEISLRTGSAEMTDFAVYPDYRGRRFASVLLDAMEREMDQRSVSRLFTIARSLSYGMNITFGRAGYAYAGTLVHNTNISGHIESMNVWYCIR